MGYERILHDEINRELDRLADGGHAWVATWVTTAICERHSDELVGEAPFSRFNSYANTRDAVRRQINARAGDRPDRDDRQLRLPGYHHLHPYYVVNRRGIGDVGIPIGDLTDREIDRKAARYEAMSVACRDHADELRQFKKERRAAKRQVRGAGA